MLMLADPLGELEPGLLFNFAGTYLFGTKWPGFIRPVSKGHYKLFHPQETSPPVTHRELIPQFYLWFLLD